MKKMCNRPDTNVTRTTTRGYNYVAMPNDKTRHREEVIKKNSL